MGACGAGLGRRPCGDLCHRTQGALQPQVLCGNDPARAMCGGGLAIQAGATTQPPGRFGRVWPAHRAVQGCLIPPAPTDAERNMRMRPFSSVT